MADRLDYLIECSRTAREELLLRIKKRDNWLKLQLLSGAILWAVAHKITLVGTGAANAFPEVQGLAFPMALIFAGLYYVEDGLIYRLSKYMASLSSTERELSASSGKVSNWDDSPYLRDYATGRNLKLRLISQIMAFVILPGYLTYLYLEYITCWFRDNIFLKCSLYIEILLLILIIFLIYNGYKERRKTGSNKKQFNNPKK